MNEVDILQTLLFVVVRNNTVMPVGLKLGKDNAEINRMSYETMLELRNMIDFDRAYAAFCEGKERYWKEKSNG